MLPTQDTNHVAEGLALRIGQYLSAADVAALLTAFLRRVQDGEDMLWDVIASQLLTTYAPATLVAGTAQGEASGPPCQALLQLADLVGCPVASFTTTQVVFLLGVWRQARRSKGRSEDLLGILAAAFGPGGFNFQEYSPAAYEVTVDTLADPSLVAPLAQALAIARPPGVLGAIAWGTWPATPPPPAVAVTGTFFFGYPPGGVAGSGLMDGYSGANEMGLLAGAVA
jgi:hypothetical protein